jgi:predicted nucleotidyltransferase
MKAEPMKTLDQQLLDETVYRLVAALDPVAIYLYGSHAYGQPHEHSDVDLFIVIETSALSAHQRAVAAYRALRGLFVPAEIKVVTRAEFEERLQWQSSLARIVHEKGKVLYEAGL